MKHFLLLIFLSIAFIRVEAQQNSKKSQFAIVSIPFDARDKMYEVRIDSGQASISKKESIMTDSFGQVVKFVSPAAALNYLDNTGWKLVEVLHETGGGLGSGTGSIWTTLSYLFKKDY